MPTGQARDLNLLPIFVPRDVSTQIRIHRSMMAPISIDEQRSRESRFSVLDTCHVNIIVCYAELSIYIGIVKVVAILSSWRQLVFLDMKRSLAGVQVGSPFSLLHFLTLEYKIITYLQLLFLIF